VELDARLWRSGTGWPALYAAPTCGPQTYLVGGAFNCAKAQPGQATAVSHGCPNALFRGVNVLNTQKEAGR
jgi:hypothetical protein